MTATPSAPAAGKPLSLADYHRLAREEAAAPATGALRVTLLGTCTLDFVKPFLVVEGARAGLRLVPRFGPFGQVEQQIGDPGAALYQDPAGALVIVMRPEDVFPNTVIRPFARGASATLREELTGLVERIGRSVEQFRQRSKAPVLVANFAEPAALPLGPFDANVGESLTYELAAANAALRARVAGIPDAAVWDLAGLVRSVGTRHWSDPRLWVLARVPVAQQQQPVLAAHLVRSLRGMLRAPAKCIVLDLDNTLWGGVIGDDGLAGIQLGDDYPGNVFKDFQRRLLALADRGILLAVASKNDEAVAREVFDKHPEMLIRWSDIAAARISWGPKSQGIRQIAKDLNIGADALVFFDDNPVEQAEVRIAAPEVVVLDVPNDPLRYAAVLDAVPWFDQVSLSGEDRQRAAQYRERRERDEEAAQFGSIEEFLASLEMTAEVGVLGAATQGRIVQLIGKTNQFNLTTRRHSAADVDALAKDPNAVVAWLRVADRFGDQGLICVGILKKDGDRALIDTLLMSCRVMNRRVEQAFAAYLVEHARRLGCRTVVGEYLPTAKNDMVKNLYSELGFARTGGDGRLFELDLSSGTVEWPAVIRRQDSPSPRAAD